MLDWRRPQQASWLSAAPSILDLVVAVQQTYPAFSGLSFLSPFTYIDGDGRICLAFSFLHFPWPSCLTCKGTII
ncbi:unnamed protein product [Victoria cruziana]